MKTDENHPKNMKAGAGLASRQVLARSSRMAFLKRGAAAFPKRPGGAPDEAVRARGDPGDVYHVEIQVIWENSGNTLKIDEKR